MAPLPGANQAAATLQIGQLLSGCLATHPISSEILLLPVQIHLDKQTAQRIHSEKPNWHTNPNYKPEMAPAPSDFGVLYAFLPTTFQVSQYLSASSLQIAQLKRLAKRYQAGKETDAEKQVKSLVLQLRRMYPDDNSVFRVSLDLKPGHTFSVAAGEPYAYITGGKEIHRVLLNALKHFFQTLSTPNNTIAISFSPPEERDVDN
ncbi:hypothetical protein K503DRAFT_800509 [Rhizopogon vinicolor AM-OR11-026]|uniref:Phosphomannose isomerase type I catalytic domain-containing protein n=1 Tax=Rhizopogon vinicolor AM-OR11-026 TaxID=1314800 RepID=A0A1B7N0J3_9AGAM|nr:hypothetical protein K503DRAFT_800509 [Rhizopogon vinicolor AM-OR11-026]